MDKLSYGLGLGIGQQLASMNIVVQYSQQLLVLILHVRMQTAVATLVWN